MAGGIPTQFNFGGQITPAQAAANYQAKASGSGTWWATKYLMAKVNPFQAASAAAAFWLQRLNEVGTAGFQAGLARVNLQAVAKLVSTQGPTLYNQGITNKGVPKYATAIAGLLPVEQQIAANLPPRGTLQQNLQRATQMATQLAAIRGQFRG